MHFSVLFSRGSIPNLFTWKSWIREKGLLLISIDRSASLEIHDPNISTTLFVVGETTFLSFDVSAVENMDMTNRGSKVEENSTPKDAIAAIQWEKCKQARKERRGKQNNHLGRSF